MEMEPEMEPEMEMEMAEGILLPLREKVAPRRGVG